jgi:6-phosphogluconolactonase (cycloisomerase 2 family)
MKFNQFGRVSLALVFSLSLLLGFVACGSGTIGYLYVVGTQYNQISGYKIDNLSGNLTPIVDSPFTTGGTDPVCAVVLPGGRYLYVLNHGTGASSSSSINLFSIGGDGVLAYQQTYNTQGNNPVWMVASSNGTYIYVLDQQEPSPTAQNPAATPALGDITAFSVNTTTGRLTLLPNSASTSSGNTLLPYFPVGQAPILMRAAPSSNYIYVLDKGPIGAPTSEFFTVYSINPSTGQLSLPSASSTEFAAAGNPGDTITAFNMDPTGKYFYQYDGSSNTIFPFTLGSNGSLSALVGGATPNAAGVTAADYLIADSHTKFLYVLNTATSSITAPSSSISAYVIDPASGLLSLVSDSSNPYSTGSKPVCAVEDPSNQYIYTADQSDSTVVGKIIDQNTGQLSPLTRAATFSTTGTPTCLVVTGITS